MNNKKDKIEIEVKQRGFLISQLVLTTLFWGSINFLLIAVGIFFVKSQIISIFITILMALVIFNICYIGEFRRVIKTETPIYKFRFSVSDKKIDIYLQNRLYKQYYWKDLDKIELVKEKYSGKRILTFRKKSNIIFHGPHLSDSVRLYNLVIFHRKVNYILSTLKKFAEILNKPFIEIPELKKLSDKEILDDLAEIERFKQLNNKK